MIEVLKSFHKLSDNKVYSVGEKVTLNEKEESNIVKKGFAKFVVQESKKKKVINKTK